MRGLGRFHLAEIPEIQHEVMGSWGGGGGEMNVLGFIVLGFRAHVLDG